MAAPWSIEHARAALQRFAEKEGASLAALSRMIGRPDRYLDRFARDGHPHALAHDDRQRLAQFFGIDDGMLCEAGPSRVARPAPNDRRRRWRTAG